MSEYIFLYGFVYLAAVGIVLSAGLSGYGEALRHRHAGVGHVRKACSLAAEYVFHLGLVSIKGVVALFKHIGEIFFHISLYFLSERLRALKTAHSFPFMHICEIA